MMCLCDYSWFVRHKRADFLSSPSFSQTLVSVPVCLILALIVGVIIKGMTGLGGNNSSKIFAYEGVLFLVFLCADAVSMFISHVAPELVSAICIATGIFGIMTIVMGFIILPSSMPIW